MKYEREKKGMNVPVKGVNGLKKGVKKMTISSEVANGCWFLLLNFLY
ncbi:hypothetical protein JM83_1911 [Gillisia sp. Hel_I_86]|nr:hypothetical protein JM83_1911 [Gillisia sp. Hel_I_86]